MQRGWILAQWRSWSACLAYGFARSDAQLASSTQIALESGAQGAFPFVTDAENDVQCFQGRARADYGAAKEGLAPLRIRRDGTARPVGSLCRDV
jgi:hypothetical protein